MDQVWKSIYFHNRYFFGGGGGGGGGEFLLKNFYFHDRCEGK